MIIRDGRIEEFKKDDLTFLYKDDDLKDDDPFASTIRTPSNSYLLIPREVSNIDCKLPDCVIGISTIIECFENLNALNDSIENVNQCVKYIYLNIDDKSKIIITINIEYYKKLNVYSKELDEEGDLIWVGTFFDEKSIKQKEDQNQKDIFNLVYVDTERIKNITLMLNDESIKILKSDKILQKKFQNRKEFLKKFVKWIYNTNESIEIKYAFPNVSTDYLNINKSNLGVEKNLPNEILNSIRNFLDGKSKKRIKKSKSKKRIKKSKSKKRIKKSKSKKRIKKRKQILN
jgi:hypothetical protein